MNVLICFTTDINDSILLCLHDAIHKLPDATKKKNLINVQYIGYLRSNTEIKHLATGVYCDRI